jgi:hypothetical protein
MISVAVMAHLRRRAWANDLADQLDAQIVWDRNNDRVETGLRSLQAYDPAASHHLIVQDDAIICRDLIPALELAVKVSEDRIVVLYFGNGLGYSKATVRQLADRATQQGASWISWRGTIWGVAILTPTVHLDRLIASYQRDPLTNYDTRLENCARKRRVEWWHTWPSLVDHRSGPSNPSLVPGRTNRDRRAYRFIGADTSALSVDWSAGVYQTR